MSDPDLTMNEKRAILASWASDACAIEAVPALRPAANGKAITFDEIMEGLRLLDEVARAGDGRAKYKKRHRFTEVTDRPIRKNGCGPLGSLN